MNESLNKFLLAEDKFMPEMHLKQPGFRTKNRRLIMQSKCPVCGIKKSRFVKEQEAKGLLSNLGIRTPLSKILLLNVLF